MYPGDLELFELVPLCREFIGNSWERPRIYCDKVHYKCFSDVQENDHGYYVLGYISVKIVNEFIRESVIESAYLNGYGYRQVENFPFS